ncbi:42712_t:CDS:1, partial [Gigaspora margarita]
MDHNISLELDREIRLEQSQKSFDTDITPQFFLYNNYAPELSEFL